MDLIEWGRSFLIKRTELPIATTENNTVQRSTIYSPFNWKRKTYTIKMHPGMLSFGETENEGQTRIFASHSYIFAIFTIAETVKPVLMYTWTKKMELWKQSQKNTI